MRRKVRAILNSECGGYIAIVVRQIALPFGKFPLSSFSIMELRLTMSSLTRTADRKIRCSTLRVYYTTTITTVTNTTTTTTANTSTKSNNSNPLA